MGAQATFMCCGRKGKAGAEPAASPVAPPQPGTQPSPKLPATKPLRASSSLTDLLSSSTGQWAPAQLPRVRTIQQDRAAGLMCPHMALFELIGFQ